MPRVSHDFDYNGSPTDQVLVSEKSWISTLAGLADMPPFKPIFDSLGFVVTQSVYPDEPYANITVDLLDAEELIERANALPRETISEGTSQEYATPRLAGLNRRYRPLEFVKTLYLSNEVLFDTSDHFSGHHHDEIVHYFSLATNNVRSYRDMSTEASAISKLPEERREAAAKLLLHAVDFKLRITALYDMLIGVYPPESIYGSLAGRDMSPEEGSVYRQETYQRISDLGAHILGVAPSETLWTPELGEALGADHLHVSFYGDVQTADDYRRQWAA